MGCVDALGEAKKAKREDALKQEEAECTNSVSGDIVMRTGSGGCRKQTKPGERLLVKVAKASGVPNVT